MKKYYIILMIIGLFLCGGFYLSSNTPKAKSKEALSNYLVNDLVSMNFTPNMIKKSTFKQQENSVQAQIELENSYSKKYELYLRYKNIETGEVDKVKLNKIDKLNYECSLPIDTDVDYEYRVDVIGPNHIYSKPEIISLDKFQ